MSEIIAGLGFVFGFCAGAAIYGERRWAYWSLVGLFALFALNNFATGDWFFGAVDVACIVWWSRVTSRGMVGTSSRGRLR